MGDRQRLRLAASEITWKPPLLLNAQPVEQRNAYHRQDVSTLGKILSSFQGYVAEFSLFVFGSITIGKGANRKSVV